MQGQQHRSGILIDHQRASGHVTDAQRSPHAIWVITNEITVFPGKSALLRVRVVEALEHGQSVVSQVHSDSNWFSVGAVGAALESGEGVGDESTCFDETQRIVEVLRTGQQIRV